MNNEKKLSEQLLKADGIESNSISDIEHTMFRQLLDKTHNTKKQNHKSLIILKTIINSRLIKPIAAVLIITIGIISLTNSNTAVTPIQAMKNIRNAVNKVSWMHMLPIEDDLSSDEAWYSPEYKISAANSKKKITFTNYGDNESRIYDPNSNTITIYTSDTNNLSKANSVAEYLDLIIQVLNSHDHAKMTTKEDIYESKKVNIHEITISKDMGTEIWRFTEDSKTNLLIRMELEGWDESQNFIKVADIKYDYPKTGPLSIYDLGVPQTAVIIDKRPTPPTDEVKAIVNQYQKAIHNEPEHYTALILYTRYENDNRIADEATIIYTDGNLQTKKKISLNMDVIDSQRSGTLDIISQMGSTFDSMFNWWNNCNTVSRYLWDIYDGQYQYTIYQFLDQDYVSENMYSKNKRNDFTPHSFYRSWTGETNIFGAGSKNSEITIYQNDFAENNDLICVQFKDLETITYHTNYGSRYKRICWLDPNRNYICRRLETYFVRDEYWQEKNCTLADKNIINNPDPSIEYSAVEIREATKYGITNSGYWYPAEIQERTKTHDNNGQLNENNHSIVEIYLDTERQIPRDIFSAKQFSEHFSD